VQLVQLVQLDPRGLRARRGPRARLAQPLRPVVGRKSHFKCGYVASSLSSSKREAMAVIRLLYKRKDGKWAWHLQVGSNVVATDGSQG